MSPCHRPSTFSIPKSLPFYVSTLLEGPKGLKRSTPSTPALPLPAVLSSRNGPPLESLIPRNFAAGSHAGWPPTWRSLVSNVIPLRGPVLMLTVPVATYLLVLLLVTFSNLPSLQMMSAFLLRFFFFCCIAERAIKPCRSSRSKLRGEFGIPRHLQNRNQKHKNKTTRQTTTQNKQRQEPASVGM